MKKIIIPILVLIIIVAANYFLFTTEEKLAEVKEIEKPTIGPVEDSLYQGAELIAQLLGDYGSYNYYAVDAPFSELISFYSDKFPDFEIEVSSDFDYWRAENYEMSKLQRELWDKSRSAFETWKELKKGMVLSVFITPYGSPAYENENRGLLEEFDNKFEEKVLIAIGYL